MTDIADIEIGLTEHLEADVATPTRRVLDVAAELVREADWLGVRYAWFAEHHAHVHRGHLPTPLLFALHLAGQTDRIALGAAVLCLNHRNAIDIAEQVAVADLLSGERMAVGFGSGSTPRESALFGAPTMSEDERHARFAAKLDEIAAWWTDRDVANVAPAARLPRPADDLMGRCWSAVNSVGAARVAAARNLNVLFSHLRTPEQYRAYARAYRDAGGTGKIAANRPIVIAETDEEAHDIADGAMRTLWRRFRAEGKIAADAVEPRSLDDICGHPLNVLVGGPATVARRIAALHRAVPFDVLNVEVTWDGLDAGTATASLRWLMTDVLPRLREPAVETIDVKPGVVGSLC